MVEKIGLTPGLVLAIALAAGTILFSTGVSTTSTAEISTYQIGIMKLGAENMEMNLYLIKNQYFVNATSAQNDIKEFKEKMIPKWIEKTNQTMLIGVVLQIVGIVVIAVGVGYICVTAIRNKKQISI